MSNRSEQLYGDEVISISDSDQFLMSHTTFKIKEFLKAMECLGVPGRWLDEGIDCETISPGKSWRKGKVRIALEFCSDELDASEMPRISQPQIDQLESPLDDIRQIKTKDSQ